MPKSKHRKKHKQKVAARTQKVQEQKNKIKKFQNEFFQQMMSEQQNGAFDEENLKELPGALDDLVTDTTEDNSSEEVLEDTSDDSVEE